MRVLPKLQIAWFSFWWSGLSVHIYVCYWKWNFPMTRSVRLSVGWLVGRSVRHNVLKAGSFTFMFLSEHLLKMEIIGANQPLHTNCLSIRPTITYQTDFYHKTKISVKKRTNMQLQEAKAEITKDKRTKVLIEMSIRFFPQNKKTVKKRTNISSGTRGKGGNYQW